MVTVLCHLLRSIGKHFASRVNIYYQDTPIRVNHGKRHDTNLKKCRNHCWSLARSKTPKLSWLSEQIIASTSTPVSYHATWLASRAANVAWIPFTEGEVLTLFIPWRLIFQWKWVAISTKTLKVILPSRRWFSYTRRLLDSAMDIFPRTDGFPAMT